MEDPRDDVGRQALLEGLAGTGLGRASFTKRPIL
jgi:hypothetical protein